mgnify:CR=1 FL=1
MKRFLLFAGNRHYPEGGMDDFQGSWDTITEVKKVVKRNNSTWLKWDWQHVLDSETGQVIDKL